MTKWTTTDQLTYRGYRITSVSYNPYASFEFGHDSYDGAPDYYGTHVWDRRCGTGKDIPDCLRKIDSQYIDEDLDEEGNYK